MRTVSDSHFPPQKYKEGNGHLMSTYCVPCAMQGTLLPECNPYIKLERQTASTDETIKPLCYLVGKCYLEAFQVTLRTFTAH